MWNERGMNGTNRDNYAGRRIREPVGRPRDYRLADSPLRHNYRGSFHSFLVRSTDFRAKERLLAVYIWSALDQYLTRTSIKGWTAKFLNIFVPYCRIFTIKDTNCTLFQHQYIIIMKEKSMRGTIQVCLILVHNSIVQQMLKRFALAWPIRMLLVTTSSVSLLL